MQWSHYGAVGLQPDGSSVDYTRTAVAAGPRLGFDVPITSSLSWWPRVGFAYGTDSYTETSAGRSNARTLTTLTISAIAPALVHLAPGFFAGLGPSFSRARSPARPTTGVICVRRRSGRAASSAAGCYVGRSAVGDRTIQRSSRHTTVTPTGRSCRRRARGGADRINSESTLVSTTIIVDA